MPDFSINNNKTNVNALENIIKNNLRNCVASTIFFTTYDGMDMVTLQNLILSIPGGNEIIKHQRFNVLCGGKNQLKNQNKAMLGEQLYKGIEFKIVKGSFHPKIYLIRYKKDDKEERDRILLIIGSKNITSTTLLDSFVAMEGVYNPNNCDTGKSLDYAMKHICDDKNSSIIALSDICNYEFKLIQPDDSLKSLVFIIPNEDLMNELRKDNDKYPLIVVSPFVSEKVCKDTNVLLATSQMGVFSVRNNCPQELYCFNHSGIDLHGKIYCKYLDGMTELYIGSSNFTESGFSSRNYEILVKLRYSGKVVYDELKKSICDDSYSWKKIENMEQCDKIIESLPQEILKESKRIPAEVYQHLKQLQIHTFCINKSFYEIKYQINQQFVEPGKYKVLLKGKELIIHNIGPVREGIPTRKGSIIFTYGDVEGCMLFDVVDLIDNKGLSCKEEYLKMLEKRIEKDYIRFQKDLFSLVSQRNIGIRNKENQNIDETDKMRIKVVDDGLMELTKSLLSKYSGEENMVELVKNEILDRVGRSMLELTSEQKKYIQNLIK